MLIAVNGNLELYEENGEVIILDTLSGESTKHPERSIDSIISRGFWEVVEPDVVVEKSLPINEQSMQHLIEVRIRLYYDAVEVLSENVFIGEISIGAWEEQMKKEIRELHTAILAITRGGWQNVTFQDWGRLGTPLREQYKYLHGFAGDIAANKDTISLAMIRARSNLYGKAGWATHFLFQAGEFAKLLPWMPRDGSTECLMGCTCHWDLEIQSKNEERIVVRCIWRVCPESESCLDCVNRMDHVETITVSADTDVPTIIGLKCD